MNGSLKNINIGYSLLLLFLKKKKEGNSLILQDHISLDSLILEKADIRKRNITEAMYGLKTLDSVRMVLCLF